MSLAILSRSYIQGLHNIIIIHVCSYAVWGQEHQHLQVCKTIVKHNTHMSQGLVRTAHYVAIIGKDGQSKKINIKI